MDSLTSMIHDLPMDIQCLIHEKVLELRAPKKPLPTDVMDDLKSYDLIKNVMNIYMYDNSLSSDPSSDNYYLHWLENDLSLMLNEDMGLLQGVHPNLRKCFPGLTDAEIVNKLLNTDITIEDINKRIKLFWRNLSPHKRQQMYSMYIDNLDD